MNKIILAGVSAAALCVSGTAFAQSSSTVSQTGSGNTATVVQENTNTSDIEQVGDNNAATANQITGATGNSVDIDQLSTTGSTTATVTQDVGATGAIAEIAQTGASNASTATISQGGTTGVATAEIQQLDSDTDGANILQGTGADGGAVIAQGDTSSLGGVATGSSGSSATISQNGDNNFGAIVLMALLLLP